MSLQAQPTSLLSLPSEVLLLITQHLDNHNLNSFLGVLEVARAIGREFVLFSDNVDRTAFNNINKIYDIKKDARKIKKECRCLTRVVIEIWDVCSALPYGSHLPRATKHYPTTITVFDCEGKEAREKDFGDSMLSRFTGSHLIKSVSFDRAAALNLYDDALDLRILSFPLLTEIRIDSSQVLPASSASMLNAPLLEMVTLSRTMSTIIRCLDFSSSKLRSLELFGICDMEQWSNQSCPSLTSLDLQTLFSSGPRPLALLNKLSFECLYKLRVQSQDIRQLSNLDLPSLNDMNITTTAPTLSLFGLSAPKLEHLGIKTARITRFYDNSFPLLHDVEVQTDFEVRHNGALIDLTSLSSVQFYMTNNCLSALEFTEALTFLCVDSAYVPYLEHTPRSLGAVELTGLSEPMMEYDNFSNFGQLDSLCFTNCSESIDLYEIFSFFPNLKQLDIQECPFDQPTEIFSKHLTHLTLLHDSDYPPKMVQCKFPNLRVLTIGIPFGDSLSDNLDAPLLRDVVIVSTASIESLTIERFEKLASLEISCEPDLKTLTVCDCEVLDRVEISNNTWLEKLTVFNAPQLKDLSLGLFEKPPVISVDLPLLERVVSTDTEVIFKKRIMPRA